MNKDAIRKAIEGEVARMLAGHTPAVREDFGRKLMEQHAAGQTPDPKKPGELWGAFMATAAAAGTTRHRDLAAFAAEKYGENNPVTFAIGTSSASGGGVLVSTTLLNDFLEVLRPESVFLSMNGVQEVEMNTGALKLSGGSSGATASYAGESQKTNATTISFREVNLTAKVLKCIVPASNQSLGFIPSMASIIERDSREAMALRMDQGFLYGDGTQGAPLGLYWWALDTGVAATDQRFDVTGSGTPTIDTITADLSHAQEVMSSSNIRMRNPYWVMPTRVKHYLRSVRGADDQYGFRDDLNQGTLDGIPVIASNVARNTSTTGAGTGGSNSEVYLIDAGHIVIGANPNVRIEMVPYGAYADANGTIQSGLSNDETVFLCVMEHDIAPRHREAICVIENADWFN